MNGNTHFVPLRVVHKVGLLELRLPFGWSWLALAEHWARELVRSIMVESATIMSGSK